MQDDATNTKIPASDLTLAQILEAIYRLVPRTPDESQRLADLRDALQEIELALTRTVDLVTAYRRSMLGPDPTDQAIARTEMRNAILEVRESVPEINV